MKPSEEHSLLARLMAALPAMNEEVKTLIREKWQATLSEQGFVTREAFDAQTKVLARTREKVDALEQQLKEIEKQLQDFK
jgi:BMFP domain-containing protein YqiC